MQQYGLSGGIITHAPQAPYFGKIGSNLENPWTLLSGGYSAVYQACGSHIDWFNVQFYNQVFYWYFYQNIIQGETCYTTYNGLFVNSFDGGKWQLFYIIIILYSAYFSGTSVSEISTYGIPLNKIVVGKYNIMSDASNGFVVPATLGDYFIQAYQSFGWNVCETVGYICNFRLE